MPFKGPFQPKLLLQFMISVPKIKLLFGSSGRTLSAGIKGRNPGCIHPFPEDPWLSQSQGLIPTRGECRGALPIPSCSTSCSFLCLQLVSPRQICTDSSTHKLEQVGFPALSLKITTLSLPLIKAQPFSSYRELKFGGFGFLNAFSDSKESKGRDHHPVLNLQLFTWGEPKSTHT